MGGCFSCNKPNVEIIDYTPKGKQYDYLKPNGTNTYTINWIDDVPEIEINFDGWYKTTVQLWPKSTKMNLLGLQRTPVPSPTFFTSSSDSGIDTVF